MRHQRGKCKVLRKREGFNHETFKKKVKELMNSTANYNLVNNNCINFALYLLDVGDFSFQSVSMEPGWGTCSGARQVSGQNIFFSCSQIVMERNLSSQD